MSRSPFQFPPHSDFTPLRTRQGGQLLGLDAEREAFVLAARAAGATLEQVGAEIGIKGERVRQIQWKANRRKMRDADQA